MDDIKFEVLYSISAVLILYSIHVAHRACSKLRRVSPMLHSDAYTVRAFGLSNERITPKLNIFNGRLVELHVEFGEQC